MNQIIGNLIIRLEVTDSTNNYAIGQIKTNDLPEGTVVLTEEQTAGRGQMKNTWESEKGKNLLFSVVLYPSFLEIRQQFMLSKVVSLGIYNALNKYVDRLKIKWPNDVYCGDHKLGGILIEHSIMSSKLHHTVIGVGLNINQTEFFSDAPNPISLKNLTNQQFDREKILGEVLLAIDEYYSTLREGFYKELDQNFLNALYRFNESYLYRSGEELFKGKIVGVNEIGQLLILDENDRLRAFHFKEVEFIQS